MEHTTFNEIKAKDMAIIYRDGVKTITELKVLYKTTWELMRDKIQVGNKELIDGVL